MPNSAPLISVIIPTFNRRKFLETAISSVNHQTYNPYELIVVDDGSTDGTVEWLKTAFDDNFLKLIVLPKNLGPAGARNVAIRQSKGDFIAFLDSDDIWEPDYLRRQVFSLLAQPDCSFVFCDHMQILQNHEVKRFQYRKVSKYRDLVHRLLDNDHFILTMSIVMARRQALEEVGLLDERLDMSHDRELYIRLLSVGQVAHVDKPLVTRVMHDSNDSADYHRWARNVFMTFDIFYKSPQGEAYKDLEVSLRTEAAMTLGRILWQEERDGLAYLWMVLKALRTSPRSMWKRMQRKLRLTRQLP